MKYMLFWAFLLMPVGALAGDGHDHGEGAFAKTDGYLSSFELSEATLKNLDLKTQKAIKAPLSETLKLPCIIKNPPEQSSMISVNYMSRVEKIHVAVGDKVKKGQTLFVVFSFVAVRNIEIKSPIDGVVSAQNVKIGQIVQQDMNMAEINTMRYFYAEGLAYLSDDISHIMPGARVRINIEGTHQDVDGVVKGFSPVVNPEDKTKSVLVYFESDDDHIFANMHCEMTIECGVAKQALVVPKQAVLGEFGHYFVFVKHGGHFERKDVVIGLINDELVEIVEGLATGDEVVVQGNYQLQFVSGTPLSMSEEKDHD